MASLERLTTNLTRQQAAHLLRRTTFGATKSQIDGLTGQNVTEALAGILKPYLAPPPPPKDTKTGQDWVSPKPTADNSDETDLTRFLLSWWLDLMRQNTGNITERMVHFYHTHYTTQKTKVDSSTAIYHQMALFRFYALGNLKTLSIKICTDNAMIRFLDCDLNVAGFPQENFARELLELYTIGKGPQRSAEDYTHFTEQDVKEAAKVLSGFGTELDFDNIDPDTGIPRGIIKTNTNNRPQNLTDRANRHDETTKNFTGTLGNGGTTIKPNATSGDFATIGAVYQELDDLIDMIFGKDQTAIFLCTELYRYFVYYQITPEVQQDIIEPLAQTLQENNFEVLPVLRQLFESKHFYDADQTDLADDTRGALIKSPVELVVGAIGFLDLPIPNPETDLQGFYGVYSRFLGMIQDQGMDLYEPFEVAGYEAYHQSPEFNRHWITASNLGYRYQMVDDLLAGFRDAQGNDLGFRLDVMALIENPSHVADPSKADQIVGFLIDHLFTQPIRQERYDYFKQVILLDNLSELNWENEWFEYLSSGDDLAVRAQLEATVREIIQSPEYQLF